MNILLYVGLIILNWVLSLFGPKPEEPEPDRRASFPNAREGRVVPYRRGTHWTTDMVIGKNSSVRTENIYEKQGKK